MPADNGTEPVADDELLFRRVPKLWYDTESGLALEAIRPHKERDKTGLSLVRAKYESAEEAAKGLQPGKSYYIAVFRAGDLKQNGINIDPRPQPDRPGHCELPELNAATRKETITLERIAQMKGLCLRIEGPFPSDQASTAG